MTTTPPEAPHGPAPDATGPRVSRDDVRDLSRLRRSVDDRKIAGVAGGLARHLDVDPLVLRVTFVVLAFFGAGLILYLACWLLLPEEGSTRRPLGLDDRSRSVALVIGGVLAALALLGKTWQGFGFPWPLALVGLAVLVLATRRGPQAPTVPPVGTVAPVPPAAPTGDPAAAAPYGPAAPTTYAGATTYAAPAAAYPQQGYASPTHQTGWVGPALPPAPPARPWPPRRRGPILFWFTLALIALAEGVLGIVDLSGAVDVVGSAYPALAVGLSGLMLLVGAFYGRAGGLILVGLVSAVVLAASTAAGQVDSTQLTRTPTSAAAVSDRYRISSGDIDLDLSRVRDLAALDGRRIHLSAGVGSIRVTLPRGVTAVVHARVDGPGDLQVFGEEHGGLGISLSRRHTASPPDAPTLVIDADLNVGLVEVSYR